MGVINFPVDPDDHAPFGCEQSHDLAYF